MPKTKKHKVILSAVIALITAELLWGVNKPVIKLGLETVPLPIYLSITILGTSLLILPLALRDWKKLSARDYLLLTVSSILSITVGNVALLMGLQRVPAINASLIGLFGPLLLFIFSVQFLKEKLSARTLIGILIAFAGAAIIVGKPWDIQGSGSAAAIGNLLIILSVMCDIVSTLIMKSMLKRAGVYQVTFLHLFVGILPILAFSTQYLYALSPAHAGRNGYIAIVANILLITIANCLFMYGLKRKKAQEVGVFSYISPITTIVAAYFILDERLTVKIACGALLIFTGIYYTAIKSSPKGGGAYKRRVVKA